MMTIINLNQRHLMGLCAVLMALLSLLITTTLYHWHGDWVLTHASITAPVGRPRTDSAQALTAAENLFGQSPAAIGETPLSHLQFHVTGIVKVGDESRSASKAYISISDGASKIYQTGDSLPYGVKVYAITSNTVIVENGGHLESLLLQRNKLQFKPRGLNNE